MTAIANASKVVQTSRPATPGKQRIVVVLGSYRSGTSLLGNLLTILGLDFGNEPQAPNSFNEMGFWENEKITSTQAALMNHIAKEWGDYGFAYPFAIDWDRLPEFRTFQEQLVSIVRAEITKAKGIWGFKDPRTCRLLPMWKQIFDELELEPLYVLAIRNPSDVVESLWKRNQIDPLHTEFLWLLRTLDAVRDAGGELRIVVDYDRWFTAPREQARAVAKALDLAWPADDSDLVGRLTETIRSDLRHFKARRPCSLPLVAKTYQALQQAAETGQAPNEILRTELRRSSECLGVALDLSIGSGEITLALGRAEFRARNFETALAAFTRATRIQPRLSSAYSSRGLALQLLNRSAEALDSVHQALSLDPADAVALRVLAKCQLQKGQLESAQQTCRLILREDTGDANGLQMIEEARVHKQKAKQAADLLFGPGAKRVSAPPIVPAPIFVRKDRASSPRIPAAPREAPITDNAAGPRFRADAEAASPTNGHHLNNGHSSPSQPLIMKSILEGGVCAEIAPGDEMFTGDRAHYFGVGESACHCIHSALDTAKKPAREIRSILDLPSGHGWVMRFLKAAFPDALLTACDLNRGAVDFCARTFGAQPVYSDSDVNRIPLREKFDLIWCGSLLTHLREEPCAALVRWFHSHLNLGGLLIFTVHGRWVERSLATGRYKYSLPDERISALLKDYYKSGFGYADYPGQTQYGISVCSPAHVLGKLVSLPDLKLVTYHEKGWDNHQDVVCLQKQGPTESLADHHTTPS